MTVEDSLKRNLIAGVEIKELASYPDQRGFFREVFRCSESIFDEGVFGQWSHSKMQKNVVKAWHYHHVQTDWWYVPLGVIETVLIDDRQESPSFGKKMSIRMGDSEVVGLGAKELCVRIPPGVLHGCRVLTDFAHLFYVTSHTYNPNEEGRHPYNCAEIDHDWGENAIVSERDLRAFVPTATRILIA